MVYRPSIPKRLEKRLANYAIETDQKKIEVIKQSIRFMLDKEGRKKWFNNFFIDEDGQYREWMNRLEQYCNHVEKDEHEVVEHIVTEVFDEDGEPSVKHKKRLNLE